MEYVDGEPLDRALIRRGRLSWEEVVAYAKSRLAPYKVPRRIEFCDELQS